MDQSVNGRVCCLVERVQDEVGVIGTHHGLKGYELSKDWIGSRVLPVDTAQDVWPMEYEEDWSAFSPFLSVRGSFDSGLEVGKNSRHPESHRGR